MVRVQIQLPDEVFTKAKKFCDAREISLSELTRRGSEYMLSVYAQEHGKADEWQPPNPKNLVWRGLSHAEIKEKSQFTSAKTIHRAKRSLPRSLRPLNSPLGKESVSA
jgi:hypothetical protein